jgi:hypothetical protein
MIFASSKTVTPAASALEAKVSRISYGVAGVRTADASTAGAHSRRRKFVVSPGTSGRTAPRLAEEAGVGSRSQRPSGDCADEHARVALALRPTARNKFGRAPSRLPGLPPHRSPRPHCGTAAAGAPHRSTGGSVERVGPLLGPDRGRSSLCGERNRPCAHSGRFVFQGTAAGPELA